MIQLCITLCLCGCAPVGLQALVEDDSIRHALTLAVVVVDLEPETDPPRVLAIGPDHAGNLLEIIWLDLPRERRLVIHAMSLRQTFYGLLPGAEEAR